MDIIPTIEDNFIELTLTDIPYGVVNRKSNGLRNLDKSQADVETFKLDEFLKHIVRITEGSIYIFCSTEQVSFIREYLSNTMTTRLCIWEKTNPSPMNGQYIWLSGVECCVYGKKKGAVFNEHCKNTVWKYPSVRCKQHPTEKPLKLMEYLIKTSSSNGIIFDPCAGSGTTLLAAKNLGRNYIGIELGKEYYDAIINRLSTQVRYQE